MFVLCAHFHLVNAAIKSLYWYPHLWKPYLNTSSKMEPIFHKCEADCINPVTKHLSDLNNKKKKYEFFIMSKNYICCKPFACVILYVISLPDTDISPNSSVRCKVTSSFPGRGQSEDWTSSTDTGRWGSFHGVDSMTFYKWKIKWNVKREAT